MENLIIYLVKASGLIAVFFVVYYIFLKKETFFKTNRHFLLAGLITAAILPLLVLTRTVWVEPAAQMPMQDISPEDYLLIQESLKQQADATINWAGIGLNIYLAGVFILIIRFLLDIISLKKLLKGYNIIKENSFRIIDTDKEVAPFSFFNYIVYNSATLKEEELESIITHEKVHSRQKHSADMILGQLFCILFWFNPFIWLYKKAIAQNLEFIADAETAKQVEDITYYQKTLLKITVQPQCIAITNHFYQSLIKKRIVMLNKKQSSKLNSWKYAIVAPLLAAFMVLFQVEVNAQVKKAESKIVSSSFKVALEVTKDSKDDELNAEKDFFKKEFDAELEFSNIKRNDKGEITAIKATLKTTGESVVYQVSGTSPIKTFNVEVEQDDNGEKNMRIGVADNTPTAKVLYGKTQGYGSKSNQSVAPPAPPVPPTPPTPPAPSSSDRSDNGHWSLDNVQINNDDMLIVINGQKQEKGEKIRLPLNQEIKNLVTLDKKEAKKKYGKDGKKGAVEITTAEIAHLGKRVENIIISPNLSDLVSFNESTLAELRDLGKMSVELVKNINISDESLSQLRSMVQNSRDEAEAKRIEVYLSQDKMHEVREEIMKARKEAMQEVRKSIEEYKKAREEN